MLLNSSIGFAVKSLGCELGGLFCDMKEAKKDNR